MASLFHSEEKREFAQSLYPASSMRILRYGSHQVRRLKALAPIRQHIRHARRSRPTASRREDRRRTQAVPQNSRTLHGNIRISKNIPPTRTRRKRSVSHAPTASKPTNYACIGATVDIQGKEKEAADRLMKKWFSIPPLSPPLIPSSQVLQHRRQR